MLIDVLFYLFCAAIAFQLFYILYFFLRLALYKPQGVVIDLIEKVEPISVVIAAWNELDNLKSLIPTLLKQNHPNFEVILVDDRSDDGTFDYYREFSYQEPRFKILRVDQTPEGMSAKKYALTLGIKASKCDQIVFTDADCLPEHTNWLRHIQKEFSNTNKVVLGYSKYQKKRGLLNIFIRFETTFTALQYLSFALSKIPYMGVGRNLAYTKSLFLESKGFQPFMSFIAGDDDLFVQKVANYGNTKIVVHPESHTVSIPKNDIKSYIIQKRRHLGIGHYYKFSHKLLLGVLFISMLICYFCFVPLLFTDKYNLIVSISVGVRILLLGFVYFRISKLFNDKQEWYLLPILELLYIFYYIVMGMISLQSKKVKWK